MLNTNWIEKFKGLREPAIIRSVRELHAFAKEFHRLAPPVMLDHLTRLNFDRSIFDWIGLHDPVPVVIGYAPNKVQPATAYMRAFWTDEGLFMWSEYKLAMATRRQPEYVKDYLPRKEQIWSEAGKIRDSNNEKGIMRYDGNDHEHFERRSVKLMLANRKPLA